VLIGRPTNSGVTRVGVTLGSNWWCCPIFVQKTYLLFSHRISEVITFLAVATFSSLSSHVVYPEFFLNSATKNNFSRVSLSLEGVNRGGPPALLPPQWRHCDEGL